MEFNGALLLFHTKKKSFPQNCPAWLNLEGGVSCYLFNNCEMQNDECTVEKQAQGESNMIGW